MEQAWAAILGAFVGGVSAFLAAIYTSSKQAEQEHNKWTRDQTLVAYMSAIRSLSRACIIPIGTDIEDFKKWYEELAEVRVCLTNLSVFYARSNDGFKEDLKLLITTIDKNDFASTVTYMSSLKDEIIDSNGFVLLTVSNIRHQLQEIRQKIVDNARDSLGVNYE